MSVMLVIVLYLYTKFEIRKTAIPKIWLTFSQGIKRSGGLDLSASKWSQVSPLSCASFLSIFSLLRPSILDLGSDTGQTDRQTDR